MDPVGEEKAAKQNQKKKDSTFQIKAHDGKRSIKIILLFDNQYQFVN